MTGLPNDSSWPQLSDREWMAAQLAVKTGAQIARELGCSKTHVSRATRAHGLKSHAHGERVTRPEQHIGQRFGLLVVTGTGTPTRYGRRVVCECDCGNRVEKTLFKLLDGTAADHCGCLRIARIRADHARWGRNIDGYTQNSWRSMLDRCYRPGTNGYSTYGGRGIVVCDRWREEGGFAHFLADLGPRPDGYSLDRIDPAGNYEPGNCRWATPAEQGANRRARRIRNDELEAQVAALAAQVRELGGEPVVQIARP